ncbi:MAG: replicative DNA helicase [Patescibacteria group bacterium]|jgi:replicative DNA helicase
MARKDEKLNQLKLPPQNIEAEKSILGSILLDKDAILKIVDFLTEDDFYLTEHKLIYGAMVKLFEKRSPIDLVTLSDVLESEKHLDRVGGADFLSSLVNVVPTAAHVIDYARIVSDKSSRQRLISAGTKIVEMAYNEEIETAEVMDKSEQQLFNVSQKQVKDKFIPIKDVLVDSFNRLDKIHKEKGTLRGVPSGYKDLDNLLSGFQPSDLLILAARPSMGKTSFALSIAQHATIDEKVGVGIFSLEMSKEQLVDRLICSQAGVDSWKLRNGHLSDDDFRNVGYAMGHLSEAPLYIDDSPMLTVLDIRTKARRLMMEQPLGLIIIDYLQLISGSFKSDGNRVQEISEISRALKGLARELNVPVMALSQLSRAVEHRDKKVPQLSDLRESGCLAGDTLIYNAKTGQNEQIKNLVGKEYVCLSLNDKNKLVNTKSSRIFSTGRKQIYELVMASGKRIKATANHKFLKFYEWVRLDRLSVGDFLATPREIRFSDSTQDISDNKIILLAHLIGDGCYLSHQPLHYTNADPQCLKIVDEVSYDEFKTKNRLVKQQNWFHLYLSAPIKLARGRKNPIIKWLDEDLNIFNQRSGEKRIPKIVFSLDNKKVSLFISHLFATDGGLTKSSGIWRLHYASKSRRLIEDLQHLLLRFEILSRIKENKKKGYAIVYDLVISGSDNQLSFLINIGIFGEKEKNVKLAIAELRMINSNTNVDIIPSEVWQKIKDGFMKLNWSARKFHQEMNWAYSGTQRYKNGLSRDRLDKIAEVLKNNELKQIADSDIFWDQIKEINKLGVEDVYDITIPDSHNFIANDMIVHNSIEQDADVVMFIYREDYYEADTERKGITDILIRKHRNGPIGSVELFFVPEQMTFRSIDKKRSVPSEIE